MLVEDLGRGVSPKLSWNWIGSLLWIVPIFVANPSPAPSRQIFHCEIWIIGISRTIELLPGKLQLLLLDCSVQSGFSFCLSLLHVLPFFFAQLGIFLARIWTALPFRHIIISESRPTLRSCARFSSRLLFIRTTETRTGNWRRLGNGGGFCWRIEGLGREPRRSIDRRSGWTGQFDWRGILHELKHLL